MEIFGLLFGIIMFFLISLLFIYLIGSILRWLVPTRKEKLAFRQNEDGTWLQVDYPQEPLTFWGFIGKAFYFIFVMVLIIVVINWIAGDGKLDHWQEKTLKDLDTARERIEQWDKQ